jgi:hypothetical protein
LAKRLSLLGIIRLHHSSPLPRLQAVQMTRSVVEGTGCHGSERLGLSIKLSKRGSHKPTGNRQTRENNELVCIVLTLGPQILVPY